MTATAQHWQERRLDLSNFNLKLVLHELAHKTELGAVTQARGPSGPLSLLP